MPEKAIVVCAGCCCGTALITGIVLLVVSFSVLEATEMGLNYSSVKKSVSEEQLYESGRHMLGVGHSFKKYPKDQQSTKFPSDEYGPLQARTQDGLKVHLELQYQYRLTPDLPILLNNYYDWGLRFDFAFAVSARNILRDVASNWTAYEFFYNRTEIEASMQSRLATRIENRGGQLDDLQLLIITLPTSFEMELTETEQIRQEIEQVEFDVKDAKVKAANKRKRMFQEALVITNDMVFKANEKKNERLKEKKTLEESLSAEISSYSAIKAQTNLTAENMLNYIWLQNLKMDDSHRNKFHLQRPPSMQCFADGNDATCGANVAPLSFSCSQTKCIVQIVGFNLRNSDQVRIATDTSCIGKHSSFSQESYGSITGPSSNKKLFNLGTVASTGSSFFVCYCKYEEHAQGCSYETLNITLSGFTQNYQNIGTLTVS